MKWVSLLLICLFQSAYCRAQGRYFLEWIGKNKNDSAVVHFLVDNQFNRTRTASDQKEDLIISGDEQLLELLRSEEAKIEFIKKTENAAHPNGRGFHIIFHEGVVHYLFCSDTLFLKQRAADMGLHYDFEALKRLQPNYSFFSGERKLVSFMYNDSTAVTLRFDALTGKMKQLEACSPMYDFFFDEIVRNASGYPPAEE